MMKKTNKAGPVSVKPKTSVGKVPTTPPVGGSISHKIEKLSNGFLHTHSTYDGKGNFDDVKTYSPKPELVPAQPAPTQKIKSPQKAAAPKSTQKMNKPMKLSTTSKMKGAI